MTNFFNLLPPELIVIIFKKLNFKNLTKLRCVDKRFKLICDRIGIDQFNLYDEFDGNNLKKSRYWFYTNDLMTLNLNNLLKLEYFLNMLKNGLFTFKLDQTLKRLFISHYVIDELEFVNLFKSIEQLTVKCKRFRRPNYELNLENLKICDFTIRIYSSRANKIFYKINHYRRYTDSFMTDSKIIFNTKKLFAFKSIGLKEFIFKYPEKILNLELYSFEDEIINFKNLEYLKLTRLWRINDKILIDFKNLKTLDLCLAEYYNEERFEYIKRCINSIINEKAKLKRFEFTISFEGVKLTNQNILNQFKWPETFDCVLKNLKFQMDNYDLLIDDCWKPFKLFNYCEFIEFFNKIPKSCFLNKFSKVSRIKANKSINNEVQFLKFLNNLPYLTKLILINCNLNKSFYEKLINIGYLINLEIEEQKEIGINFDFILNTSDLSYFRTNQLLNDLDLLLKLINRGNILEKISFKLNQNEFVTIDIEIGYHIIHLRDMKKENMVKTNYFNCSGETIKIDKPLKLEEILLKLRTL